MEIAGADLVRARIVRCFDTNRNFRTAIYISAQRSHCTMAGKSFVRPIHLFFWYFIVSRCYSTVTDIECLKAVKDSIKDPQNYLSSWNFNNNTEGFICNFAGVDCWNLNENKVLNLKLSGMDLEGNFPLGLQNCTSLTGLDLSSNNFSGPIPDDISTRVKFVTILDLSSNKFTGQIPPDLGNCSFLNELHLQRNQLTGTIPSHLSNLNRLGKLDLSDNLLTGKIPRFNNTSAISSSSFANNPDLCGTPLPACEGKQKTNIGVIVASAVGFTVGNLLVVFITILRRKMPVKKKGKDVLNKWTKNVNTWKNEVHVRPN